MKTLKSIGAILGGFLTVAILSVATDKILEGLGILTTQGGGLFITWMLVLAFAYRTVYAILGGYVTASLAPGNRSKHVHILGIIGTVGGCIGIIAGWNFSPHWYPIALAVTAYPSVWLGGKLKN